MIDLTETPERKWCVNCENWFVPRACNAEKQKYCCKTKTCQLTSKSASNRKWRRKKSGNPDWQRKNVLRSQRIRRIRHDGFDGPAVAKTVDDFVDHLNSLFAVIEEILAFLEAVDALFFPILLQKLPRHPATLKDNLKRARDSVVSGKERTIFQLKTIPKLTLRDDDLPNCA